MRKKYEKLCRNAELRPTRPKSSEVKPTPLPFNVVIGFALPRDSHSPRSTLISLPFEFFVTRIF